jgi:hypothetical protein
MVSNFNNIVLSQQAAFNSLTTPIIANGAVTAQQIGTQASAIIQDITYTSATGGTSGNSISVTYIESVLPGYETVEVSGDAITVNIGNSTFSIVEIVDATHLQVSNTAGMQDGDIIIQGITSTTISSIVSASEIQVASTTGFVIGNATDSGLLSTATQILTAFQNTYLANVLVITVITGTPSNKQVSVGMTSLSGGEQGVLPPTITATIMPISGNPILTSLSGEVLINSSGNVLVA